jgi:hypothetical protein
MSNQGPVEEEEDCHWYVIVPPPDGKVEKLKESGLSPEHFI